MSLEKRQYFETEDDLFLKKCPSLRKVSDDEIKSMERKGFHPLDDLQRTQMNDRRAAKARIDTEFREFREAHV